MKWRILPQSQTVKEAPFVPTIFLCLVVFGALGYLIGTYQTNIKEEAFRSGYEAANSTKSREASHSFNGDGVFLVTVKSIKEGALDFELSPIDPFPRGEQERNVVISPDVDVVKQVMKDQKVLVQETEEWWKEYRGDTAKSTPPAYYNKVPISLTDLQRGDTVNITIKNGKIIFIMLLPIPKTRENI